MRKLLSLLLLVPLLATAQVARPGAKPTHVDPNYLMPPGKFYVNTKTIPTQRFSYGTVRIKVSCEGTYAQCTNNGSDESRVPKAIFALALGSSFRLDCKFNKSSFDDPIVYTGRPGRSHLHSFFGSTATSTQNDLANQNSVGNSSCQGGRANLSGYWVPSMIYSRPGHPRDGEVQVPEANEVYYKEQHLPGGLGDANWFTKLHDELIWPPVGFRMIGGDPNNRTYSDFYGRGGGFFACVEPYVKQFYYIPSPDEMVGCTDWEVAVGFKGCINPTVLDSPDHRSHLGPIENDGIGCAARNPLFPKMIPSISYNIHYHIKDIADFAYFRLSSDPPRDQVVGLACASEGPAELIATNPCAGVTNHADWVNGWSPRTDLFPGWPGVTVENMILENCIRSQSTSRSHDCHTNLLGTPELPAFGAATDPYIDGLSHKWYTMY